MAKKKYNEIISDPFREIAFGLSHDEGEEVWEEEPVGIVEFIESKKFLNQAWKWNKKKGTGRGCRPKIMDIAIQLVKEDVREAILLLGKGSGKDYISAIINLFGIHRSLCMYSPQAYYDLAPGSPIYFINTARNDTQAKKVFFAQFKGLLLECPWFADKMISDPGVQHVSFKKKIEALSVNSQAFGWLGFNTLQWVGDELAFFLTNDTDEESESRAEECWEAAYGSCQTRFPRHYKMIGITTPRYDDDFVMKKFYELNSRMKRDGSAYIRQASSWDMNPNTPKSAYKYALERNFRRAMRDFGAEPSGVIESFWSDPDYVENNVCDICKECPIYINRQLRSDDIYECYDYDDCRANAYRGNGEFADWFYINPDDEYYMHFDLSKNKDRVGFVLVHRSGEIEVELDDYELRKEHGDDLAELDPEDFYALRALIKVDAIGFISPASKRDPKLTKNKEIYYDGILKEIILKLVRMGCNIELITFDQFQSHYLKQQLEDEGLEIELLSLDRTDEVPVSAKLALTENRTEYPYSRVLCSEAKHLKYIKGKKVDHARKKSKDIWDGFAGAIHNCDQSAGGGFACEITDV